MSCQFKTQPKNLDLERIQKECKSPIALVSWTDRRHVKMSLILITDEGVRRFRDVGMVPGLFALPAIRSSGSIDVAFQRIGGPVIAYQSGNATQPAHMPKTLNQLAHDIYAELREREELETLFTVEGIGAPLEQENDQ